MTETTLILHEPDIGISPMEAKTRPVGVERADPMTWLDQHGDALYAYALMRVREPAMAEDLVQDTLVAALKSVDKFEGKSTERTWLTGILKHKVLDHLRKSGREQPLDDQIELDEKNHAANFDESGHWAHKPADWDAPEQALEKDQFWDAMNDCISRLPERLRILYVLRELDDLETDEIITTLNLSSRNNLWTMLSRARMQLRQCLELNWFGA